MALLARAMGTFDPLSPWRVAGHGPPTSDEGSLLLTHVFDADEKGTGPHAGLAKYAGGGAQPHRARENSHPIFGGTGVVGQAFLRVSYTSPHTTDDRMAS